MFHPPCIRLHIANVLFFMTTCINSHISLNINILHIHKNSGCTVKVHPLMGLAVQIFSVLIKGGEHSCYLSCKECSLKYSFGVIPYSL